MPLVPAKCPQCGGDIQVDSTHEAGLCKFCNTPFVTEKAINNYFTTNNINIQNATINVQGADIQKLKKLGDEIFEQWIDTYSEKLDGVDTADCKKALGYYERVIECEDSTEYKLKAELCNKYIKYNERYFVGFYENYGSEPEKLIEKVKGFITKDDTENNHSRISEYPVLFHLAHSSINLLYSTPRSNGQVSNYFKYVFLLLDFCDFMTKYNDVKGMHLLIRTACRMHDLHLYQTVTNTTLNLSEDDKNTIKKLGNKIQSIYNKIGSTFTVAEDVLKGQEVKQQGCYIATCVYGSYDCPKVWVLRRYRDYRLSKTWYGRLFISTYYLLSPKAVKVFGKTNWFKKIWQHYLDKKVSTLIKIGYKDTPYND